MTLSSNLSLRDPSAFSTETIFLHVSCVSHVSLILLDLIALIICDAEYKSCLLSKQLSAASNYILLGRNIIFITMLQITLILYSFLNVRDQVYTSIRQQARYFFYISVCFLVADATPKYSGSKSSKNSPSLKLLLIYS